ncbi:MAG: hypothetical protein FWH59_03430 [Lentimicrobiaceae bacterium]|nr:hypothetical protein [Lentimicrobiaceae bacterium]
MKKITLFLLLFLFAVTYSLQAQKQFAGEIQFKTKIEGTDDPNLLSSIESMTSKTSILGNKSKTVMNFGGMQEITNIWDGDKETSIFVIEIMGMGKYYKKTSTEERKEEMKFFDFSYSYEDDFKEICGYKCQKVIATKINLEDDAITETFFYITKELGGSKIYGEEYPGLEGFPLLTMTPLPQYCDECKMAMEAIKITPKKIKDIDFLLPDDAKNIDESPELKEMLGY